MNADKTEMPTGEQARGPERLPLRAGDYLWRPWYAKAWWIAIPVYWLPAGTPLGPVLEEFYTSDYAVVTNILFLPLTAGMVLGFGYMRRLLDERGTAEPWYDYDIGAYRPPGMPHPSVDELNPRSGPQWVGNRLRQRLKD